MTDQQILDASPELVDRIQRSLADPRVRTKKQCWDAAWLVAAAAHLDACERKS